MDEPISFWRGKGPHAVEYLRGRYKNFVYTPHSHDRYMIGLVTGGAIEVVEPKRSAVVSCGQVTLYNVFEGLTRLDESGSVQPLLARSWRITDDGRTYSFELERGVTYHDGAAFDAADVKAQFARNASEDSTNKLKALFRSFESVEAPDSHTVVVKLPTPNGLLLFYLAQAAAVKPFCRNARFSIRNHEAAASRIVTRLAQTVSHQPLRPGASWSKACCTGKA